MKQFLLNQSLAIRTKVLPEVEQLVSSVNIDLNDVRPYETNIKEWLSPVIDLNDFFVYPTNGITEGLNWWYAKEKRSVYVNTGDYQWIKQKEGNGKITYISIPNAADGNFCNIPDTTVALDLAYIGSTNIKKITINDNVEFVFFSLSKSFGLRNIRTGWFFSREKDEALEQLISSAKYYNYHALAASEAVIKRFDVGYIHKRLEKEQSRVCNELNLIPSDSVWLATSFDPIYQKFRRKENIARLCLSGVYNYEEKTPITDYR